MINMNTPKTTNLKHFYTILTSSTALPRCVYLIYKDNCLNYFTFQDIVDNKFLFLESFNTIKRKITITPLDVCINVVPHPWVNFLELPRNIIAVNLDEFGSVNNTAFFGRGNEPFEISPIVRKTIMLCTY